MLVVADCIRFSFCLNQDLQDLKIKQDCLFLAGATFSLASIAIEVNFAEQ